LLSNLLFIGLWGCFSFFLLSLLKPPFHKAFKAGSEHKKTNLKTKTEPKPNPKNEPENRTEKQTEPPPPKIKMQSKNSL
jgi:hypothetical protein